MADIDPFAQNIDAVQNLVGSDINKVDQAQFEDVGELTDVFELDMTDEECLKVADEGERNHKAYYPRIESRAKKNAIYLIGEEYKNGDTVGMKVASNLIFEAQTTFKAQALAKNPEPVIFSDNTDEGQQASNDLKTMLQYKADTKVLRRTLGFALDQWSVNFIGVIKHGWDDEANDFKTEVRNSRNFVWADPKAYIDETGRYRGNLLGERVPVTAKRLCEMFPKHKEYITDKVEGKMGTEVTYTEWRSDKYCFYKFEKVILDKHRNEFFNYPQEEKNTEEDQEKYGAEPITVTKGKNHFAIPLMPYSFFSVFSLQQQPHDITNLIEQAIPQQNRIVERDLQITKNLRVSNNSLIMDEKYFTAETAQQGATGIEDGDPILGNPDGVKRLPASPLPNGILQAQQNDKDMLRQIFGTYGITPQQNNEDTTARGQILKQDQDSSRIGGGVGEALEQLADNVFNWWVQMIYVFYDEPHYGAILGLGKSVEFVKIINSDLNRQFVVSVSPNSMAPRDEIALQNTALSLWGEKAIDPLTLMKLLPQVFPDPNKSAQMLMMFMTNPQQYAAELGVAMPQPARMQTGGQPGEQIQNPDQNLSGNPPSSGSLQEIPIQTQ